MRINDGDEHKGAFTKPKKRNNNCYNSNITSNLQKKRNSVNGSVSTESFRRRITRLLRREGLQGSHNEVDIERDEMEGIDVEEKIIRQFMETWSEIKFDRKKGYIYG